MHVRVYVYEMRRGRRAHATKVFRRGATRKAARKPRNMGMRGGSILSGENKYPSPYTLPARPQLSKNPAEMVAVVVVAVVADGGTPGGIRGGGGINSRFRIARNREATYRCSPTSGLTQKGKQFE